MAKHNIDIKRRGVKKRLSKPLYLIIAEGRNKTETLYFSNFQESKKPYRIQFVKAGSKTDAESLYNSLMLKWKELELSSEKGDKGFIVLDIDNDDVKAQKILQIIKENKKESIHLVVSNPTFEIWLLLHFKYTTKFYKDGDAVIADLKKYILDYEKNKDCYSICLEKISDALKNSEKLEAHFKDYEWPSAESNPRTDVWKLVKLLIDDVK